MTEETQVPEFSVGEDFITKEFVVKIDDGKWKGTTYTYTDLNVDEETNMLNFNVSFRTLRKHDDILTPATTDPKITDEFLHTVATQVLVELSKMSKSQEEE